MSAAAIYCKTRSRPGSLLWPCVSVSIVSIAMLAAGCKRASCDNQAFYGLPSPDGRYIAFIFHRTCLAPAGVTTQVSLMPFHEALRSDPGNVLSVAGAQPVQVFWHGPRTLWITGFNAAAYQRHGPLDGISIEYH